MFAPPSLSPDPPRTSRHREGNFGCLDYVKKMLLNQPPARVIENVRHSILGDEQGLPGDIRALCRQPTLMMEKGIFDLQPGDGPTGLPDRFEISQWLKKRGKVRQATMSCLDSATRSNLRTIFEALDTDGGGSVDAAEIRGVLRLLGYKTSKTQARKIIQKYDLVGSQELDPDSFAYLLLMEGGRNPVALSNFPLLVQAYKMRKSIAAAVFDILDTDNSGSLGRPELWEAFKRSGFQITPEEFEIIFKKLDDDGSGQIDFDEFMQVVGELVADSNSGKQMADLELADETQEDGAMKL
mmetsp:Transcript_6293/g.14485  ORF Transcript_6293/g.14485 Transcript_6293/m.14485 type:complete len:297 (+) Transcript_6293:3-893(+)